jgi:transcriptional regulator with XRE-family HTH domain
MLGQTLREARTKCGLTQSAIAKQFGYSSPQFVSNWERDLVNPPTKILPKLCRILKINTKEVTTLLLKKREDELKRIFKN